MAQAMHRNTLIEDAPQVSLRRAPPPQKLQPRTARSPLSDSFPTPRAAHVMLPISEANSPSTATSDSPSDGNSLWSKRSSESEFDEMYDLSGSESEGDVPIKLSSSVKKRMVAPRNRYPSLVIPSPSEWPTLEKLKSAVTPLSPPPKIELARSVLEQLASSITPGSSSTPSLDGSLSDEEPAISSCPSTPDISQQDDDNTTWEVPIQLDPSSISLLQHINGDDHQEEIQTVLEVSEEAIQEMRQIVDSPQLPHRIRLETQNLTPANPVDAEEELSELSIPSPGGFFASLRSSTARHTWCPSAPVPNTSIAAEFYDVPFRSARADALPTSTAARFYDLPWTERPDNPVEQTITLDTQLEEKDEPVTARRIGASPIDGVVEVNELDEAYDDALKANAAANIDRTMLWLNAQNVYMKAVCEEDDVADSFKDIADAVPKTPEQTSPPTLEISPGKKSVRFADEQPVAVVGEPKPMLKAEPKPEPKPEKKRVSPIHDGTFWEGWGHTKRSQRARDVFLHRQARAEAEHVKRTSCQTQHVEQLQGKFEIKSPERPAPSRPISDLIGTPAEDHRKFIIDRAERERQALEQMQSSSWHMSAHREISGGKLLTSPVVQSFKGRKDVRILDLGGQVHCSWAWNIAMEHPDATVYTTVSSDAEAHVAESTLEGPANHFVVAAPRTWELPFDDSHFDIISARQLYAQLKHMWPKGQVADEWDLTLRECLRCLKPGGCLEFNLLDAELVHPESASQALGVEFAFNLKTRGYDPSAGKTFLPRLKRAGFQDIKRAWMVLPVADVIPRWIDTGKAVDGKVDANEKSIGPNGEVDVYEPPVTGSTKDIRAVTGMVGARMWEQWMLKLNCEMGRNEVRCLEGVAKALEEAGKGNAGWRCLVGWARKA